jgi:D-3-phosphoglycerate dehydrogenase
MDTQKKPRVLMAVHHLNRRGTPYVRRLEEAGCEVVRTPLDRAYTEDELIEELSEVFATMADGEPYTDRVFREAKGLKLVARFGVGYENIDVSAATRHGVIIAMAFGANHESVADCAFSMMAALAKNLVTNHFRVKAGGWGFDLHHGLWRSTVGIVGLGRIGKAVARRCRAFEMQVLAYDVKPDAVFAQANGITLVPLETLLSAADFVTLHTPLTPKTEHLINRERLGHMKRTAFLINTARGGLVDEEALVTALTSGMIAGAALDVFKKEPPTGSPLLGLDNVILSPHCADADPMTEAAVADRCIASILAVVQKRSPGLEYVLNPEVLASMPLET